MAVTASDIEAIKARRLERSDMIEAGVPWEDADALATAAPKDPYAGLRKLKLSEFNEFLKDKWWRMNHLYLVVNEDGEKVLFKCRRTQKKFFNSIWYRNVILKARQLGFTTFIALYFLDDCLFNDNIEAGIIAHTLPDAQSIFRRKVKFPYENLPPNLKKALPLKKETSDQLIFANNSSISVSCSMRSNTAQRLHVSELGKIAATYPEKAREIVTGALEAVPKNGIAVFESTAEGSTGYFYDICKEAQDLEKLGRKPSQLEFKFFFAPWWEDPKNALAPEHYIPIPQAQLQYLENLEGEIGRSLSMGQKCWWVSKWKRLGDDVYRENPSTSKEAFLNNVLGAYFTSEFNKIRAEKRICAVPYNPAFLVDTWWDLGMNDVMAIWFTQDVGRELHVIDYLEDSDEGFAYYADLLNKKGYRYGQHNAPHDISVRELGTGESRMKAAAKLGIKFGMVPRCQDKQDSIQAARSILSICWFDESKCALGLSRLENYRKAWDEHLQTYKRTPLHNDASNGSDAFQTLGQGHGKHINRLMRQTGVGIGQTATAPPVGGWT